MSSDGKNKNMGRASGNELGLKRFRHLTRMPVGHLLGSGVEGGLGAEPGAITPQYSHRKPGGGHQGEGGLGNSF